MPRLQTTAGQLLVNEALPQNLQDYTRVLDKKAVSELLSRVAKEHPERYREISHNLANIGRKIAYTTGGFSFGLRHLRPARAALAARQQLQAALTSIGDNDDLTDEQREQQILLAVGRASEGLSKRVYDESLEEGNPLARQILSGARGNPMNLSSLRSADFLYTDHRNRVLPLPVLSSYSEGLTPAEYWAGTYGARKGTMDTKFATQDAGFLSKQLNQIAHRAVVVDLDRDGEPDTLRGYPVDTEDPDNEGSLLASPVGGYPRNTVLTPKVLSDLRRQRIARMLVRSPMVGGTPDGGVYARDVGFREFGRLPTTGENVGLTAAQALSEPLSQAQLSSKHSGGVASSSSNRAIGGFELINQLVQTPKTFKGGAAHSTLDGTVEHISEAPAGGQYVSIGGQRHYVGAGFDLRVKPGDKIEAGDVISEGIPDPAVIVEHKGVGEGRRYFVNAFRQAFRDAGIRGHRRNIELLASGLINHVRLTDEIGDYAPDDVVPYAALEHSYQPRDGHRVAAPTDLVNQYLEKPYLHYSIGTKLRPSMLKEFQEFGVSEVAAHPEPPPFQPEMVRGMANMQHDPDWITRMLGSGQKASLLSAAQRGAYSDETGTSFVPGLAKTVNFGRTGKVQTPKSVLTPPPPSRSETYKAGESQLVTIAQQMREIIKQADQPGDRWRDKRTPINDETRISVPFAEDITMRGVYDDSYHQALPEGHGFTPKAKKWDELSTAEQQQHINAIRHANRQLRHYSQGLDRNNSQGGTGSNGSWRVIPHAVLSNPLVRWSKPLVGLTAHSSPQDLDVLGTAFDEYGVPAGTEADRSQFLLPSYSDEITDIPGSGSMINPWAWNPQRHIQRYNEAVKNRGPITGETLVRATEGMRQAYPEAFAAIEADEQAQLQAQMAGTGAKPAPAAAPGLVPYTAPSGQRMLGQPEQIDQQLAQQVKAAPSWNDGPGYQPGYGLLPLAQMANQASPGVVNSMLQTTGFAGLPLLTDMNALPHFFNQAPRPAPSPVPPPPAPAAPAPAPPPKLPQVPAPTKPQAVAPAKPQPTAPANTVAKPPVAKPAQPAKPATPLPSAATSGVPKPTSPVPGG